MQQTAGGANNNAIARNARFCENSGCILYITYFCFYSALYVKQTGKFAVHGENCQMNMSDLTRAYSKRVFRTNCALRIKKCAPWISSGIYFLSTS